jgi:hypothetical protein
LPGRVDPSVILLRYDLITNGTSSRIIFHARLPKGHDPKTGLDLKMLKAGDAVSVESDSNGIIKSLEVSK